jgi:hypothetical protein
MNPRLQAFVEQVAERTGDRLFERLGEVFGDRAREPEPLMDATALARYLGVRRDTIYQWVQEGRITPISLDKDRERPRLRFDHRQVLEELNGSAEGESREVTPRPKKSRTKLLPVKGEGSD